MMGGLRALVVLGRVMLPLCAALAATSVLAQATYKWVDENGKTHFSDTPPPDRKADRITIKPQVAENPEAAARSRDWRAQLQESGARRLQDQLKQEAADRQARTDERRCAAVRADLDVLQRGRVFRYGSDGQKQYLDDKDRPAALKAAQDDVEKYCR